MNEINKILGKNIVKPTGTEWAAPRLFDPAKDKTIQSWLDYLKVFTVAKRDWNPVPRLDEFIELHPKVIIFSTPDVANIGKPKLIVLIKIRPHSNLMTITFDLFVRHSGLATHPAFSDVPWPWFCLARVTISSHLPPRYSSLLQDAETTHKTRTQRSFNSKQHKRHM